MAVQTPDIQPLQKPIELPGIQLEHLIPTLGPGEMMLLQALVPQAKPVAVPVQNLDHVALAVAKGKQVTRERIQRQFVLHQNRKPVDRLSHVGAAHRQIDPGPRRQKHHSRSRVWISCLRATGSKSRSTSMRRSPPTIKRSLAGDGSGRWKVWAGKSTRTSDIGAVLLAGSYFFRQYTNWCSFKSCCRQYRDCFRPLAFQSSMCAFQNRRFSRRAACRDALFMIASVCKWLSDAGDHGIALRA